jgi:hypothetical protein
LDFSQFGSWASLASIASAVTNHVCHVFGVAFPLQVIWVYAFGVAAKMRRLAPVWTWFTMRKYAHDVVGFPGFPLDP